MAFLLNKKELEIEFKKELDAGAMDINRFVGKNGKRGGGAAWPPFDHELMYWQRLVSIIVTNQTFAHLIATFALLTALLLLLCRSVQEGVLSHGTLSAVTAE